MGNTFLGLSWLLFSLIQPIWGVYTLSISNFGDNGLLKNVGLLTQVNCVTGSVTFAGMVGMFIVVIISKLYGAKVSLAYSERIAKLRLAKLK